MSIFTNIGSLIMGPIIRKEINKKMKDFIQPFLDLIKALVQPESGTKFLITLSGMGGIIFLTMKGFVPGTWVTTVTLGAMVIMYYIADLYHKRMKNGGSS